LAGTLTIHSNGDGGLLSGHSWIEYQPDGGESHTYGTWGNDPLGTGHNGLFSDLEKGRTSDASRKARLTDEQEKALFKKIGEYQKSGDDAWGYLNPCSGFAADAWGAATGEKLDHRSGIISNPSKLKESINAANKKSLAPPTLKPSPARPASSRRPIDSPIEQCPLTGAGATIDPDT